MEEKNKEDLKKKVDESWKETVGKEKQASEPIRQAQGSSRAEPRDDEAGEATVEVTFTLFVSGLMMEALIALGALENPVTKKKEANKAHAKFIIDTLAMLQEKTKNNLAKDEADMLDSILYELRMRFVSKTNTLGDKPGR